MLKKVEILITLLLVTWATVFPQHLSHQVLVPAAGIEVSNSVVFSQTIGETAVEIINSPDYTLTQGFQQPGIKYVPGILPEGNGVDVYPNPTKDDLKIKLFGDASRDFLVQVINITGNIVISENVSFTNKFYIEKVIHVGQLNKGIYFVRIRSTDKLINRTFKIDKM